MEFILSQISKVAFYEGAPVDLSILLMMGMWVVSNNDGGHVFSSLEYLSRIELVDICMHWGVEFRSGITGS